MLAGQPGCVGEIAALSLGTMNGLKVAAGANFAKDDASYPVARPISNALPNIAGRKETRKADRLQHKKRAMRKDGLRHAFHAKTDGCTCLLPFLSP